MIDKKLESLRIDPSTTFLRISKTVYYVDKKFENLRFTMRLDSKYISANWNKLEVKFPLYQHLGQDKCTFYHFSNYRIPWVTVKVICAIKGNTHRHTYTYIHIFFLQASQVFKNYTYFSVLAKPWLLIKQ